MATRIIQKLTQVIALVRTTKVFNCLANGDAMLYGVQLARNVPDVFGEADTWAT